MFTRRLCLNAQAQDGTRLCFHFAELDPLFIDSQILLADTGIGKPLPCAQGRRVSSHPKTNREHVPCAC